MHADNWAIKAKNMGFRSRAVFKLEEILKKIDTKKSYQNVLDIGSSPGGWSQYIIKKYCNVNVYAVDMLDMEPIDGVHFYKESIENIDYLCVGINHMAFYQKFEKKIADNQSEDLYPKLKNLADKIVNDGQSANLPFKYFGLDIFVYEYFLRPY